MVMSLVEELPLANFIRVDLFPAQITKDDGTPQRGDRRVIVTDSFMVVLADSPKGPIIEYLAPMLDFEGDNKVGWTVTTETESVHFKRAPSCGCGSRLRGLRTYPGVPYRGE